MTSRRRSFLDALGLSVETSAAEKPWFITASRFRLDHYLYLPWLGQATRTLAARQRARNLDSAHLSTTDKRFRCETNQKELKFEHNLISSIWSTVAQHLGSGEQLEQTCASTCFASAGQRKEIGALLSLHDQIDPFEIGTEHEQNPPARAAFLAAALC